MKKLVFSISLLTVVFLSSCGPAAENREAMYARAKVFQDSIANVIKSSMDAVAAPASGAGAIMVDTTIKAQPTTAPTTTNNKGC